MIRLTEVSKQYGGPLGARVDALAGVTLEVPKGAAVGLVGLNGAGKSTLLRVMLGYVRPSSGEVALDGLAPRAYVEREGVGYVAERVAIPGRWTVRHALRTYAMLGELGDDAWDRVERAVGRLGLGEMAERKVGTLSKGNLQRLAIAQALLGDRKLMVLDEPTDGLDPEWIAQLRDIVAEWRAADAGRTLLIASHNLPEVERVVDRVVVLHEGRVRETFPLESGGPPLEERFLQLVRAWRAAA